MIIRLVISADPIEKRGISSLVEFIRKHTTKGQVTGILIHSKDVHFTQKELNDSEGTLLFLLCRAEDITYPSSSDFKVTKEDLEQLLSQSEPKVMLIIPPEPDTCQVCATKHAPDEPHNKQSLFYQMKFHQEYGRWPTWEDAIKHCPEEVKAMWREQLKFFGEKLD